MTENETASMVVGNDRKKLLKRLQEARWCLSDSLRKPFGKGTFDFEKKELIGNDPRMVLQWRTRLHPDQPESYENQQCSRGIVVFMVRKEP